METYLDAYLDVAGIRTQGRSPLWRTTRGRSRTLTENRLQATEALLMIKRRARDAGLSTRIGCHTFRATGITEYLRIGGTVEKAAQIAAHESTRTTGLYDHRNDEVSLDEIERIII